MLPEGSSKQMTMLMSQSSSNFLHKMSMTVCGGRKPFGTIRLKFPRFATAVLLVVLVGAYWRNSNFTAR